MSLYCFSIIPPSVPFSPSRTSITPTPGLLDKSSPCLTRSFIISISLYYCSGLWGISSLCPSKPLISTLLLIFEFKNHVFLVPESVWYTSISSRCKFLPCEFKFLSVLSIHPASKKLLLQVWSLASLFSTTESLKPCCHFSLPVGGHSVPCSCSSSKPGAGTTWDPLCKRAQVKDAGELGSSCWKVGRRASALGSPLWRWRERGVLSRLQRLGAILPRPPHEPQVGSHSPSPEIQFFFFVFVLFLLIFFIF